MKRMSIAETTLQQQIENFRKQNAKLAQETARMITEMRTLDTVVFDLEAEQARLRKQREVASAKPKGA
jgi:cell division protein FtsB